MSTRRLPMALFVLGVIGEVVFGPPPPPRVELRRGGFVVLAVDFHVHSFLGDGALAPWLIVREARRRGLDAIAITNHNRTWPARLARWLVPYTGGSIVLVGEEVTSRDFHIAAVGVQHPIGSTRSASDAIDAIHAQGGIAIAAHPGRQFWPAFDDAALEKLDGAERAHPDIYQSPHGEQDAARFFARARLLQPALAAIGSSDFHVVGYPGICRTYVFARDATEGGILEAIRAGRTVVYDQAGRPVGDPTLIPLLPPMSTGMTQGPRPTVWGLCVWLGLVGLVFVDHRKRPPL
jgi:hypothetical protein